MGNRNTEQGEKLKRLRKALGLTQEKMAEEIGISVSLYKKNEAGRQPISFKTAKAIEERFGVDWNNISFGKFREGAEVWTQILECDEMEKLKILIKLQRYFMADNEDIFNDEVVEEMLRKILERRR